MSIAPLRQMWGLSISIRQFPCGKLVTSHGTCRLPGTVPNPRLATCLTAEAALASANIAFTSMWFHSEMNVAFVDAARIKTWSLNCGRNILTYRSRRQSGCLRIPKKRSTSLKSKRFGTQDQASPCSSRRRFSIALKRPPPTKSGQVAPGSGILLLRYDWGFGSFIRTSGAGVGVRDEIREQLSLIGDRACHAKRSEFPDSSRAGILCRAMGCKEKR